MNSVNLNIAAPNLEHDYNNSIMPVIKFDYSGNIIYANMSSFDLLINWHCYTSSKLPKYIYEDVLTGKSTINIYFNNKRITFLVVPFPEAKFIGLYAFEINSTQTAQLNN